MAFPESVSAGMLAGSECRDDLSGDTFDDISLLSSDEEDDRSPAFFLAQAEKQEGQEKQQRLYAERTRQRLDSVMRSWEWYSIGNGHDPKEWLRQLSEPEHSDKVCTVVKGFLYWLCDRRRGPDGQRYQGVRHASTLRTIIKYWCMAVKLETGRRLEEGTVEALHTVIAKVAREKNLDWHGRRKTVMYQEDFQEFARVFLTTTEMQFFCGWSRIQELLFCQLLAITGSRPGALTQLRYGDISLSLQVCEGEQRPRLVLRIRLTQTKQYLGPKPINSYPIPDIPFDPILVISPHIFLLGMLFYRRAFKVADLDGVEKLYRLKVPKGLRELSLELRDEIKNDYLFCELDRTVDGVRLDPSAALSAGSVGYSMRRVDEITGFATRVTPYCLRYGAAKTLNDSSHVSTQLQNVILQHRDSSIFEKHYSVDVHVDLQGIWRGDESQNSAVTRVACSLSRTIDPRRPIRLTGEDLRQLEGQPTLQRLRQCKEKLHKLLRDLRSGPKDEYKLARRRYEQARRKYRNAWDRARRKLLQEKRERFLRNQPVQDVEHQLRAGSPEAELVGTVPDSPTLTPQHLALVEAVLQPPGETAEADVNRLIAAVHAVREYCGVVEGTVTRPTQQRGAGEKEKTVDEARLVSEAKAEVIVRPNKERSRVCFLCLGDERKTTSSRVHEFSSPGALTKHFESIHLRRYGGGGGGG